MIFSFPVDNFLLNKEKKTVNIQNGDGVIIGANAVVTHDVPSNSIVGGVLAKIWGSVEE